MCGREAARVDSDGLSASHAPIAASATAPATSNTLRIDPSGARF
jgi:hypothetical protein